MAEARQFVCDNCQHAVAAWSDGNPYYIDAKGGKHYAYHPDHEALARCVGNDSPHLCLACGSEFMVDSRAPASVCPECTAAERVDVWELDGWRCPFCKQGVFRLDDGFFGVS